MTDRGSTAVERPARKPEMKKCPMCAETIRAEAKVCRYCGARFAVSAQGYCETCHQVVPLDGENRCARCHGDVVDRRLVSELTEPGPAPAPTPTAPAPAPAAEVMTAAPVVAGPPAAPAAVPVAPAVAPGVVLGLLRRGYIGNRRQWWGEAMVGAGMVTCFVTTALGWGGTDFFLLGLNKGVEEARPGPWFLFVPLIAVALGSKQLKPSRVRGTARRLYWPELRSKYGIKRLYAWDGARRRAIVAAVLWTVTMVLAIVMGAYVSDRGMDVQPGTYILLVAGLVGLVGSLLFLPGSDNQVVLVDEEGNLFQG